jgi:hypothetical protein
MRDSRRIVMFVLATSVLSWGISATAQNPPKPTTTKPTTAKPRPAATSLRTRDPFIGLWKLNPQKSKYESGGAPKSFTRTYEDRGGGTVFMITDAATAQGSTRAYLVYKRDGKPYPEAAVGADSIRMVTVRAVDPRTEEIFFIIDGKTSEMPSTITISADGMTMTQVLSGKNARGAFTNTVVYDKQP